MGYIAHHALLVTAFRPDHATSAWDQAHTILCDLVTPILEARCNGYLSFAVLPDGSKEGWEDSEIANSQRATFIAWLRAQRYEDGSSPYAWALVQYGDDAYETLILESSDHDQVTGLGATS